MKQEATKKSKKWIWLIAALAAVLVIAGVVLALFLLPGQQGGPNVTGGRPELYWNIDREFYTKDAEMGFSTREKGEDGLYHIRFAHDGEQVELPVSDKRLVNFIDTMDIVALVQDADGVIVDVKAPKDVAFVIAENYFVRKADGTSILANSSMAMNGMETNIKLSDTVGVYDVTPDAEMVGQPGAASVLDEIMVYGDLATQEVTHVFIVSHPMDGEVYWRVQRMYDTATGTSTREPDENGVYTILFACNGEQVELKCKDPVVVGAIDALAPLAGYMTLMFDEEGYIIDMNGATGIAMVLRGKQLGANYRVDAVDGNVITATKVDSGNDQGKTIQFTCDENFKLYNVDAQTVDSHVGEVDAGYQVGDATTLWSDLDGNPVLGFVLDRLVPGPMYYNLNKHSIDAETGLTTHLPDEKGYYVYEMLADRKLVTVRTKDIKIATLIDAPPEYTYDRVMGLELDGDIVKRVYSPSCVSGMWSIGYQRYLTVQSGPVYTFAASDNLENFTSVMLASDVKIIDVSGTDYFNVEMGSETTLNLWDRATIYRNIYGEANYIYVTHRYIDDAELYCVADRQWDATNLVSKREPDADGYYVFQLTHEGKQLTAKTKNKELVQYIDKQSPAAVALKIEKGIIKGAYPKYSVFKSGSVNSSWQYIDWIKKDGSFATWYTDSKTGEKTTGWPYVKQMSKNCKVYNISSFVESYKGEETTLRVGDQVQCIMSSLSGEIEVILVLQRYVDSPFYWNMEKKYDWTNKCSSREPDADGYYVYDLFVEGYIKQFRTKSKELADQIDSYSFAFALETDGDLIKNAFPCMNIRNVRWAVNYNSDVTKIDGDTITVLRNLTTQDDYGTSYEMKLAKDCQIWDVSASATFNGEQATLTVGDRVVPIANSSDEICCIFIVNKMTRTAGVSSLCDHCGEVVTWSPFSAYNFTADGHYYLASDLDQLWQITIGAAATEDAEQNKADIVLDLNGNTLTQNRQVFSVYGSLTIIDSAGGGEMKARNEKNSNGAAIIIHDGGVVNMHAGTLTLADEASTNKEGGLLMINPGGTFNLYNGTLKGGKTAGRGGNVFVYGGTFNMYGGTIIDGAASNGPNVFVGSIGENVGTANICGGKISGGVKADSNAVLKLEGAPVIDGTGIRVSMGDRLILGDLKPGASIYINGNGVFAETEKAAQYLQYFHAVGEQDTITQVGNTLVYNKFKKDLAQVTNEDLVFDPGTTDAVCPACGMKVTWTALQNDTKYTLADGGHYFVPEGGVTFTDPAEEVNKRGVFLRGSASGEVCLHLNGNDITSTNTSVIQITGAYVLNIMGNGTISGHASAWSGSAMTVTNSNAIVNLVGGTYTKSSDELDGSVVLISTNGGTINMYSGATITAEGKFSSNFAPALTIYGGGSKSETNENDGFATGNNPALAATFNMYGGKIVGGTNTYGTAGRLRGGNVLLYTPVATMNVLGGTVIGGEYAMGGGDVITVMDGGALNIGANATVTAGESGEAISANLKDSAKLTIAGTVNGSVDYTLVQSEESTSQIIFTGKPVVSGPVNVTPGTKLTLKDLQPGTSITVKADGVFAELPDVATAQTYFGYFKAAKDIDSIVLDGTSLKYLKATVDYSGVSNDKIILNANGKAVCPACNEEVEWITLETGAKNVLQGGKHYLVPEGGITWDDEKSALINVTGGEVCLHLNGNNITATGYGAISVTGACDLNIMGNGTVSGAGSVWSGNALHVNNVGAYVNLIGGTYTKAASEKDGTVMMIGTAGGTINMYSGVTVTAEGKFSSNFAPALTIYGAEAGPATVNMYGGKIVGGTNTYSNVAGAVRGGNVLLYTPYATMNVLGGTITGGEYANAAGDAISVMNSGTLFIGENATVVGGSSGEAIYAALSQTGKLTIAGTVNGDVGYSMFANKEAAVILTGKPVITGRLDVANGTKLTLVDLKEGASVKIKANGVFAELADEATAQAYAAYFVGAKEDDQIVAEGKSLKYIKAMVDYSGVKNDNLVLDANNRAVCPACGIEVEWIVLETNTKSTLENGKHYVVPEGGITWDNEKNPTVVVGSGDICLHLNGNNITSTGYGAIQATSATTLNIMGNGTISGRSGAWSGNALTIANGAVVNMIGGTYTKNAAEVNGSVVLISTTGGTINMYSGATITAEGKFSSNFAPALTIYGGGQVTKDAETGEVTNDNGGYDTGKNPAMAAVFNMFGGKIVGGTNTYAGVAGAVRGGNILLYTPMAELNAYSGTITGGEYAHGAGDTITIMNNGKLFIGEDATVTAGASGQAIYGALTEDGKITIAGTVNGEVSYTFNKNVVNTAELVLTGKAKITGLLNVQDGTMVTLKDLAEGASIKVKATGIFAELADEATATAYAKYFVGARNGDQIVAEGKGLKYVKAAIDYSGVKNDNITLDANNRAVCPACGIEVEWTVLQTNTKSTLSAGGHYIVPEGGITWDNAKNPTVVVGSGDICLHLNGNNITSTGNSAMLVNNACELNIMGHGTISGYRDYGWGGSAISISNPNAIVNLIGGTYTKTDAVGTDPEGNPTQSASVIFISTNGGTVNMYSGATIGTYDLNSSHLATNVALYGGEGMPAVFNMFGGKILGGNNLHASNKGGSVELYHQYATFNMEGGKIDRGTAAAAGASIYARVGGTVNIGANAIVGGAAGEDAIYLSNGTPSALTVSGKVNGTVGFLTAKDATVVLKGAAVIESLMVPKNMLIDMTGLTAGAEIGIAEATGVFTTAFANNAAATAAKNYVKTAYPETQQIKVTSGNALEYVIAYSGSTEFTDTLTFIGDSQMAYCPACQNLVNWTALSGAGAQSLDGGKHYYLSGDLTHTGHVVTAGAGDICLHLNGYSITSVNSADENGCAGSGIYKNSDGTLNIMGAGTVSGSTSKSSDTNPLPNYWSGAALTLAKADAVVNIYNGTFTKNADNYRAPIIYVSAGTANMHGGKIDGDGLEFYSISGSVTVRSSSAAANFNLYAGEIVGSGLTEFNTSGAHGRAVYVSGTAATFRAEGGTVSGYTENVSAFWGDQIQVESGKLEILGDAQVLGADAIYVINGDVTVSGTVEGILRIGADLTGTITVSGDAKIGELSLPAGKVINATGLTANAQIGVSGTGVFTTAFADATAAEAAKNYFTSKAAETELKVTASNELEIASTIAPPTDNDGLYTAPITWVDEANKIAHCPVCDADVTWTALTAAGNLTQGHYYLENDINTEGAALKTGWYDGINYAGPHAQICLHLNNHNIISGAGTAITIQRNYAATLNIMGAGTVTGSGGNAWVGSALLVNHHDAVVNLYSGTYTKASANTVAPIVFVSTDGGTVNMYADAVIDATDRAAANLSPAVSLYGGGTSLTVGDAVNPTYVDNNDGLANEANAARPGVFNMYGGEIKVGTAGNLGYGVSLSRTHTQFNMLGGAITGGEGYSVVVISHGAVNIGAEATINGTVAAWSNTDALLTVSGTVTKVSASNAAEGALKLTGAPVISNLTLASGVKVDATGMTGGTVTVMDATGVITTPFANGDAATAAKAWILSGKANATVETTTNNELELVAAVLPPDPTKPGVNDALTVDGSKVGWCPACQADVTWVELSGTGTAMQTAGEGKTHFYLSGDYSYTNVALRAQAENACLHLNGHTMSATSIVVDANGRTVNIMGQGTITSSQNANYYGVLMAQAGGILNILSDVTITKDATVTDSKTPLIHASGANSVVNINGNATIGTSTTVYNGGNSAAITLREGGCVNMNAGTVYAGNNVTANAAGAITWYGGAGTFNMQGGTIAACTVEGTDDYAIILNTADAAVVIGENAVINSANAVNQWSSSGTLTVSGHITGKVQVSNATNGITLSGTPEISNLSLSNGAKASVSDMTGGNVVISAPLGVFTEAISTNPETIATYFTPADPTTAEVKANVAVLELVAPGGSGEPEQPEQPGNPGVNDALTVDGSNVGWCPACEENVTWVALSGTGTAQQNAATDKTHFYLSGDYSYSGVVLRAQNANACLHLNGHTLTATSIAVDANSKTLNIMGQGTISSSANNNWHGVVQAQAGGTLNILSDLTVTKTAAAEKTPLINANGTNSVVNIEGNATVGTSTTKYNGGNSAAIALRDGGCVNMNAGTVYAGDNVSTAGTYAGAVTWYSGAGTFNMQGGTIEACTVEGTNDYAILMNTANAAVVIGENAVVKSAGNAINQWSSAGTLTVSGHVTGKVQVSSTANGIILSGTPEISNLSLASNVKANATGMTGGNVVISAPASGVITTAFANANAATAAKAWFSSATTGTAIDTTAAFELQIVEAAAPQNPGVNDALTVDGSNVGWCPACEENVTWVALSGTGTAMQAASAENTHFYLSGDYSYTSVAFRAQNANACLHLNGHTLTSASIAVDANGKVFNIMGQGTISSSVNQNYYGVVQAQNAGTLNILSNLTITKDASAEKTPLIHANGANSVVNIEGNATVGTSTTKYNGGNSAAIALRDGGCVNMNAGTVYAGDNVSTAGTYAGAVTWYSGAGTFNMQGGTIEACTVEGTNDYAILMNTANAAVVIGENAVVKSAGNAINQWSSAGTLTVSGHITGKVQVSSTANGIILSGTPEISNLSLASNVKANATGMTGGNVVISAPASGVITTAFANANAATAAKAWFSSATANTVIDTTAAFELQVVEAAAPQNPGVNDALTVDGSNVGWCPACEENVTWVALSGTGTAMQAASAENTHFYLSGDYSYTSVAFRAQNANACLHLNGHTLTSASIAVDANGKVFNIMGQGTISSSMNYNYWGVLMAQNAGTLNILSDLTVTKDAAGEKTPLIHASGANSVVNINGNATIGTSTTVYNGGNSAAITLREGGCVNMNAGTVYAGNNIAGAYAGAVLWYSGAGTFNMQGGSIEGCTVEGCDDYAILMNSSTGNVVIGENAVINAANAINQWSSGGALTVSGHITGKVQVQKAITLTGTPELNKLALNSSVVADATGMTGGSITVDGSGVITTAFASGDAANAAKAYFVALEGYELSVTGDHEIQQTLIPVNG